MPVIKTRLRSRKRTTISCKQCGKTIEKTRSNILRGGKFCGFACYVKYSGAKRVKEDEGIARCAKCKTWKPIAEFVRGVNNRPHSYCKECSRVWFEARRRRFGQRKQTTPEAAKLNAANYKRHYNRFANKARRRAGPPPDRYELSRMLCEQDARCTYCGVVLSDGHHIDHKTPISKGGTNDIENLHYTCPKCNMRKGTMTHEEFLVSKKHRPRQWVDGGKTNK